MPPSYKKLKVIEKTVDLSDEKTIQAVWEKGKIISGFDKNVWRRDKDGHAIERDKHGDRDSDNGWEMDHIKLRKDGGKDVMTNLRPLYWKTNAARQGD